MKQSLEEAAYQYELATLDNANLCVNHEEDNYDAGMRDAILEVASKAFIAGAEWQAKQSPWISVTMTIPNEDSEGIVQVKNIDGKEWEMCARKILYHIFPYITTGYITHWRIKKYSN